MTPQLFESKNGKIITAIYEDYFVEINVFNSCTSIKIETGSHPTGLRLQRCIENELESTKETFENNFEKAMSILSDIK